jgi:hypothetical protein
MPSNIVCFYIDVLVHIYMSVLVQSKGGAAQRLVV